MPVKIMCAGCPKNEREPAEAAVKAALGQVAGSWTVSLVKIGRQWSMSVDGPEVKHKTLVVPEGGIKQAIQELLSGPAPASSQGAPVPSAPASRAPAPPTVPPSSTAPRAATPLPAFPPPVTAPAPKPAAAPAPASRAPLPPTRAVPAPVPAARPASAERAPSSPARGPLVPTRSPAHLSESGKRKDRYECEYCGGAFLVIYETGQSSSQETVAVACPHCWKNSHVMVAEEAALSRDYRSEKA
jgi:DNA-directed RNA polymerase subunit RPC12/RpoP